MSAVKDEVKNEVINNHGYNLISVKKTDPPEGIESDSWYQYVIKRADSIIEGKRSGTLGQVTAHANEFIEELNSRTGIKGKSTWVPNRKK